MKRSKISLAAVLVSGFVSSAVLVGCDSKSDAPAPTTPPAVPKADSGTPAMPQSATDAMKDGQAKTNDAIAGAQKNAADATAAGQSDAQAQVTQVMQYIKDNKLDLADQTLTKLEANKASFPDAVQKQIESARSGLNAAKAGGGLKAPEMPAIPK